MAAFWVCLCAYLNCVGWILSALHALNPTGYACALVIGIIIAWRFREPLGLARCRFDLQKQRRRHSRFLPAGFAIVAGLAILGGILHAPSNYDALSYRVPRILHWLGAEQWHWTHTMFHRLNTRAVGYEWVAAPLMSFTRTDRLLFLINVASLLLLPGLVYRCYRQLGISARVAWNWMWILPTGYCFILQAGGIGNDLFGAVFALASLDFALRARTSGRFRDVAVAMIAAGMLTGSKTSNIPLVLPCALTLLPTWKLMLRRPFALALTVAVALGASFVPIGLINHLKCGDWTGSKVEDITYGSGDFKVTLPGNALILTVQNFVPPVFPLAPKWNAAAPGLMPESFHKRMKATFEPSGANLSVMELQNEEMAGAGFGVSVLVCVAALAGLIYKRKPSVAEPLAARFIRWSPWVSALGYGAKATIGTAARIFTPYYLLLIPALISARSQEAVVRSRWWKPVAGLVFLCAFALVVITPSRPLWPAVTVLEHLAKSRPESRIIQRLHTVYSVYGQRAEAFAEIRDALPPGERVIGLLTFDDPETSLWRPFGSRRFLHVLPSDSSEQTRARGIRFVLVNARETSHYKEQPFEQWLATIGGAVENKWSIRYRASSDTFDWYLVRLGDTGGGGN